MFVAFRHSDSSKSYTMLAKCNNQAESTKKTKTDRERGGEGERSGQRQRELLTYMS